MELNPNVVTNLTGSNGNGTREDSDECQSEELGCTVNPFVCNTGNMSCEGGCASKPCSGENCFYTIQDTCTESEGCIHTESHAEKCCAITVDDTCMTSNHACPATNTCNTCVMCVESEDCPPVNPTETKLC